jgi:hypothetical protein
MAFMVFDQAVLVSEQRQLLKVFLKEQQRLQCLLHLILLVHTRQSLKYNKR